MSSRQHTERPVSTETDGLLFQRLQVLLLASVILVLASCSFEVSAGLAVTEEGTQLTSTFRVAIGANQYQAFICDSTIRQNIQVCPERAATKEGPKEACNKMNTERNSCAVDAVTPIKGFVVSANQFAGRVQISTLVGTLTEDPAKFGDRKVKDGELDPVSTPFRNAVQRPLRGAKKKNVGAIAAYIRCDVAKGEGILPTITLFSPTALTVDENESLQVPHGQKLFALDGETQLTAWHDLWKQDRDGFGGMLVPVVIHHGREQGWAEQAYCDLNGKGIRPNRNQVICRDHRELETSIVDSLAKEVPLFKGGILRDKARLPEGSSQVITFSCLYDAVCAMLQGRTSLKKTFDYRDRDLSAEAPKVVDFFKQFTTAFATEITEREDFVISSHPAMLGIGAYAKRILDPAATTQTYQEVLARLRQIDWSFGGHWTGILLESASSTKLRRKKDGADATLDALAQPESADGLAITKASAPALAGA